MDTDVLVIGAGVAGLFQLLRAREAGFSARVLEAGGDVGGIWYWNRYPGARFDSESYSYGYSFSPELLTEWEWSEHFAARPETLRYLQHVAQRFDLRRDITFGARVTSARWDEGQRRWTLSCQNGLRASARFLIAAIGGLSAPAWPALEGMDAFAGEAFHTAEWPHTPVDFSGKRVGVIGTGASGVQVIQEIAKRAAQLTVFQRTPNWCAPLGNRPITSAEQREIHARYPEIFARCNATFGGFLHDSDRRKALDLSPAEREAFYEELYAQPGFALWMGNFRDVLVSPEANATLSAFVANKIRARVKDPALAERLIPRDHGFGTRRVPLESGYYEVYNQPNVRLVDLRETPIRRVTPTGIETGAGHHDLDSIVYATGFDAVTGPFARIDIRGDGGRSLREAWANGPRTYLGLQSAGFPNLIALNGPHNAAAFCNMPRCLEHNVAWTTDLLRHLRARGLTRVAATPEAEEAWGKEVGALAQRMLLSRVDSWFTGVNRNLPGRSERSVILYLGGFPAYQARCQEVAESGYTGFAFA
jgi:cation diffusion facilitator CzcD-associated flavoprotein CzcO